MDSTYYIITYEYFDKRHYRRTKELRIYNKQKAINTVQELNSKIGQENGPIETPHIVIVENDKLTALKDLK